MISIEVFIDVSRDALAKAQGAWYRMEKTAMKNHRFDFNITIVIIIIILITIIVIIIIASTLLISFVDRVDALKLSVYANAVLCLK